MLLFGDLDRAQHFVDRALSLDPNHAWAWTRRGFLNVYRGEAGRGASPASSGAIRLSPLDPFSFNCFIGLGFANFAAGQPAEAVEWTQRAMREKVGMTWAYRDLATFLAPPARSTAAREALAKFVDGAARRDHRAKSAMRSTSSSRSCSTATSTASGWRGLARVAVRHLPRPPSLAPSCRRARPLPTGR